jgi:hypothetical protein
MTRQSLAHPARGARIALLALLWWLLLAPLQPVLAHGNGRALLLTTLAGDFHLTVWCAPGILRAGEIHIVTAVRDAVSDAVNDAVNDGKDAPRADVLVQVALTPLDEAGAQLTTLAHPIVDTSRAAKTNDDATQACVACVDANGAQVILHEAAFVVTTPGRYEVQVDVVDAAGVSGAASFPITVVKVPAWFKGVLYGQVAVGGLVAIMLLRRGQKLWLGRQRQAHRRENVAVSPH